MGGFYVGRAAGYTSVRSPSNRRVVAGRRLWIAAWLAMGSRSLRHTSATGAEELAAITFATCQTDR